MGQIITTGHAIPKRANLVAIQTGSLANYVPEEGEIILVSKGNEMELNGDGVFDYYIKGDGVTKASELELIDYAFVHGVKGGKYLYSICDKDGYVICGITKEGKFFIGESLTFGNADIREVDNENKDTLFHILDGNGNMLMKINRQGVPVVPKGMIWDGHESGIKLTETDQWLLMFTDSNNKIIAGIDKDGALHQNAIEGLVSAKRVNNDKYLIYFLDKKNNLVFGIDKNGQAVFPYSPILSTIKFTSNKEFCYSIISQNGYVLWGIRGDGSVYQPKGIPTEAKEILAQHSIDIEKLQKDVLYVSEHGADWSDETYLELPKPALCGRIDIVGAIPTNKYVSVAATLSYADFYGNRFTKNILYSTQGNISGSFDKKNFSVDLLNSNDPDDAFEVKFGDWIVMDSFHLKAYYSDFWKIRSLIPYRHAEQISQSRPYYNRRPWDQIWGAAQQTQNQALAGGVGDVEEDLRDGALGRPDGFPVMVTINGIPYGLYTLNIKKDKDNYHITKNDDNGKQIFMGDYTFGLFRRYNYNIWDISQSHLYLLEGEGAERSIHINGYSSSAGAQLVVSKAVSTSGLTVTITNESSTYTYPVYLNGSPASSENTWEDGQAMLLKRAGTSDNYHFDAIPYQNGKEFYEGMTVEEYDYVWKAEAFNFKVNGVNSGVTLRRLFRCKQGQGFTYDTDGYPCVIRYVDDGQGGTTIEPGSRNLNYATMNPSYVSWKQLEVRNPKKTICRAFTGIVDGQRTYQLEYYDFDSPNNYAEIRYYERTHEIISAEQFTKAYVTSQTATGASKPFSAKEYNRSVNTRAAIDEYSKVIPIIEGNTITAQNLFEWGFLEDLGATVETYQSIWDTLPAADKTPILNTAKKQIFSEHHDTDFNLDFFLVYNDTLYYDSIYHNTLYTMYDGKKLIANLYDMDISMGMSSTYINNFPAVSSSVIAQDGTFAQYLWAYFKDEIKARWADLRSRGVITSEGVNKLIDELTTQIGTENYKNELKWWSQPSYRTPVYWRMPAGALKPIYSDKGKFKGWGYDETINGLTNMPAALKTLYENPETKASTLYDSTKQYYTQIQNNDITTMYCIVEDGETVHWYQCTTNAKGQDPTTTYTCGGPASGGVLDSPRRCKEWFAKRLEYLDTAFGYTPNP